MYEATVADRIIGRCHAQDQGPHFHARYGDDEASIEIADLTMRSLGWSSR
jgi:hypothetical protein